MTCNADSDNKLSTKREFSEQELLRYSRQIMLPSFDVAGQLRLANASVLIIGLGGLGSPASMYLAAAGVGRLILADFDQVDDSNLQRQIVHRSDAIGQSKVCSAAVTLKSINDAVQLELIEKMLEESGLQDLLASVDLVLDCSDNFSTRFALNKACVKTQTPLVSGAAIRMEGQITVFDTRHADSPCYQCLYPSVSEEELTCSESGVMSPLVGIIGSMQAMEAIKVLSDLGNPLVGKILLFDAMTAEWRTLRLKKDPKCPCCNKSS